MKSFLNNSAPELFVIPNVKNFGFVKLCFLKKFVSHLTCNEYLLETNNSSPPTQTPADPPSALRESHEKQSTFRIAPPPVCVLRTGFLLGFSKNPRLILIGKPCAELISALLFKKFTLQENHYLSRLPSSAPAGERSFKCRVQGMHSVQKPVEKWLGIRSGFSPRRQTRSLTT